jgi:hypothetical protein
MERTIVSSSVVVIRALLLVSCVDAGRALNAEGADEGVVESVMI